MESPLSALSNHELEVFEMTGRVATTHEAADHLHLSVKTVESYRSRVKAELEFKNGTTLPKHAVAWVECDRGLVPA
ncbi:LuxR C-terminal-related transcriptional regulator [Rubrivirga sp. S365]|uniref:LuxR C-terminal-related transcriptional regulator n=1 Tax=Rubrivirga sp. S365 TaxID=3076080 RepID=UPI0028C733FA|nr:LuxR C-terminal-related transcriptional regulator [Rubrivirga sp. S365]MDT7858350.1 LuxR C-terminal-related transcriptional regulator [Rubrivirga sp. S365]